MDALDAAPIGHRIAHDGRARERRKIARIGGG
jgi:hypothetical protein